MYKYPYGDSQQLNLDWIIAKLKELEASGGSGGADLEEVSNALISLTYNTSTAYRRYDYAFLNGKLYRCLTDTSGVFNPTSWQEALIGDDLAVLTRWINAIDAAAVVDVKFDTSGTNGKIQQKYHDQYHDVVEVDYTPVQNSKRPLSSNAGYELNGAISAITPLDTVPTNGSAKGITSDAVYDAFNTVSSGTITKLVATGTLDSTTCIKKGNVICVSGRIHNMTDNDGASRNYFQIPYGFRPPQQVRCIGYIRVETATSATETNKVPYNVPIIFTIQTTGIVNCGYGSGVTVSQVGFSATYFA